MPCACLQTQQVVSFPSTKSWHRRSRRESQLAGFYIPRNAEANRKRRWQPKVRSVVRSKSALFFACAQNYKSFFVFQAPELPGRWFIHTSSLLPHFGYVVLEYVYVKRAKLIPLFYDDVVGCKGYDCKRARFVNCCKQISSERSLACCDVVGRVAFGGWQ